MPLFKSGLAFEGHGVGEASQDVESNTVGSVGVVLEKGPLGRDTRWNEQP